MNNQKIKELIDELVQRYGDCPEQIAEGLGIEVVYLPLEDATGAFQTHNGSKYIFVKQALRYSPERHFVIAHELYHAIVHSESDLLYHKIKAFHGKYETQANKFATWLLQHGAEINEGDTIYFLAKRSWIPSQMVECNI
ncbi:TPA: ImmA/IrrE family metallo-endopeptidase [Streptococcus suis]